MASLPAALALTLGVVLASSAVEAAEPGAGSSDHGEFVRLGSFDQFIVGACSRSRADLVAALHQQRSALDERRLALSAEAGDGNLSARDIALTILLPGGLLYAAHRQDVIHRAQARLTAVQTRMHEITAELNALAPDQTMTASAR